MQTFWDALHQSYLTHDLFEIDVIINGSGAVDESIALSGASKKVITMTNDQGDLSEILIKGIVDAAYDTGPETETYSIKLKDVSHCEVSSVGDYRLSSKNIKISIRPLALQDLSN